ncbi:hypothetical protein UA38_21675 [Photobacterium kishitanii]|uniref:Competence protein CoiA nuclease-like domain-containing protein n=2 Tax=Photobacterium kishitanii TaxID=318456 RepID=A0AAX0YTG1_9GAMM|nr:hypothetical protein [Photobacterium kishitanii]KJG55071.1 hypothetical protein UA38_21675 [Photobacterium kishitanii]KJG63433.1 hypothetical protein UA40_22005 [Photobacterium kishitanii]PSX18382.1 hypothetical protein C0W70_16055 [Photobacterium kishitanii]PSX26883.1 hypothetical protein C0W52_16990 [Photobacterium kishitanii]PSX31169.1 hypothetical protein C0W39_18435 [Photobacterium kishitanii]
MSVINVVSRPLWEVFYGNPKKVTTVGRLLENPFKPTDVKYQEILANINKAKHDHDEHYLRCSFCNSPLYGRRNTGEKDSKEQFTYAFCHNKHAKDSNIEKISSCPFYTGAGNDLYKSYCSDKENEWRTNSKYDVISELERSKSVLSQSIINSHFIFSNDDEVNTRRKPDIYFEDQQANKWAVEFYRSWITTYVAYSREAFFRKQGINLLWLFPVDNGINSAAVEDYIMFGSNNSYLAIKEQHRAANNVFYFGEKQLTATNKNGELTVLAKYPVINKLSDNEFDVEFLSKEVSISEMSLSPNERLPFAVDTKPNLMNYRNDVAYHLVRLRKAYRYCKAHLSYTDIPSSILTALKAVRDNLVNFEFQNNHTQNRVNTLSLRLQSYCSRAGKNASYSRSKAAANLLTARDLRRNLTVVPLRKFKQVDFDNLKRLGNCIPNLKITSQFISMGEFYTELNTGIEGLNQLKQQRVKTSHALLTLRKLERRVGCFEYLPQEHISKTNELRSDLDFALVSSRTSAIVAHLNQKIDKAITRSFRHYLTTDIRKVRSLLQSFSSRIKPLSCMSKDDIEQMNQGEITQALTLLRSLDPELDRAKGRLSDVRYTAEKRTVERLQKSLNKAKNHHADITTKLVAKENRLFQEKLWHEERLKRINTQKEEFLTSLKRLHELYLVLKNLELSLGNVMQRFDLALLHNEEAIIISRKINEYLDSSDCSIDSDVSYLNYTDKNSCKQLVDEYWSIFGVFKSDADLKLASEFDALTDKLELLNAAIRKREKNVTDLHAIQLERESLLSYVKHYGFQALDERLKRSRWHSLCRQAESLLSPSWSQKENVRGKNGDKNANREQRDHNASVLTQIRHQERDIRRYCSVYVTNKGVKLNLNGTYGQLKRNINILNEEHLSNSTKLILESKLSAISELYASTINDQ